MTTKRNRGPIKPNERDILGAHSDKTDEQLSEMLGRSVSFVKKHRAQLPVVELREESDEFIAKLHLNPFWSEVRRGLMGAEVAYFEQMWAAYMRQFSSASDILATDDLMVKDLLMLDIFAQRAVSEKADVLRRIKELERKIDIERALPMDERNEIDLQLWNTQLNGCLSSKITLTKEHLEYQKQKDAKLKDLKGSREQRFRQIQESNKNFFELIKELDTIKSRQKEGKLAEKVKLAASLVVDDWNDVFEYEDGTVDKPYLSPEGEIKDAESRASEKD